MRFQSQRTSRRHCKGQRYRRWSLYSLPFIPGKTNFPESRVGSHVRRFANVTTDTAFAFHSGTSGSEGHRAIADMFCWLAARVALLWEMTHLCRNPQTVGRGSARRFPVIVPKAAPQGFLRWHCQPLLAVLGKIFRCKGMKPLSDGLGIHCQQAEIFLIIA